jgi:MoaA/NifB/PqqE/SkfB family radical SAM enzyme
MSFPEIFYIETVLGCNLSCPECPMGNKSIVRHHNVMSLDQYVSLTDKIVPYAKVIYPFVWGEPTLHSQLPEMIGYAKKFTKVNLSTNANLITREMAERIMAVKPNIIDVPLDAASEETYQIVRSGGSFEKAVRGLKFLKKFQTSETIIRGQFVVFKHNIHELPLFKTLCDGLQIPMRTNIPLIFNNKLVAALNWRRPHYNSLQDVRKNISSCEARIRMVILNNGDVVPCCFDYNSSVVFGNLFKQSVQEIWFSPAYVAFRTKVKGKAHLPPNFCLEHCPRFTISKKLKLEINKIKDSCRSTQKKKKKK